MLELLKSARAKTDTRERLMTHRSISLAIALLATLTAFVGGPVPTLSQQLLQEKAEVLARAARAQGDANRGALVFHRTELSCARCHTADEDAARLGPDLAKIGKDTPDVHLVESILLPSKVIKKGFETVVITTKAGKTITGLVAEERGDAIILRDSAQDGKLITILKKDIDERNDKGPSLMPEGLVNILSGRQEFLDLVRYVMEIAEKGPERARELRPAASLFAAAPLPAYERDLDHAGLLRSLDSQSLKRGETIYVRVCANCHGTKEQPGSMPTSLRFAEGKFKNGAEPFRMYQTLTHGFGMMTPQTWMVPEQKYDVIHYIREIYLKPHNPSQYARIDDGYLAALPKGTTRGPKPSNIEPWVMMDYGPSLMATLEVGAKGNFAYKGIAMRLDNGPGGVSRGRQWMLFDHDTMRMAAAWTGEGFIDWNGINFNGRHAIHPRLAGQVRFANPVGPGWANPETGRFDDPRLRGRDGKPYGPLPRAWAQYRGLYHHGNQAILSYTVGDAKILESPTYDTTLGGKVVYTRTLNVGKSSRDLLMRVAPVGIAVALVGQGTLAEHDGFTLLRIPAALTPVALKVLLSDEKADTLRAFARSASPAGSLEPFAKGGPKRWPEILKTQPIIGNDGQAFAIDVLTHPASNPWHCQMRLTGFDFHADGHRAAVCTWDGDVWLVDGIGGKELAWQRIASGLFQPLGLKIVQGKVYVCCRDQIVILHDLNGDGETDYYECFNNDHQVTEHFHEFAMGLQTDAAGNFYYARGARHALKAIVPHHGGCGGGGASETKRIIILINGDSPFWDACRVGVPEAEKEFKLAAANLHAVVESNDGTPQGQLDKLRQFASQSDIVAIGISPCDAANVAIAEEMRNLQKRGIHVITIDSDVDRAKLRDSRFAFIGTDNLAGGKELGKCLKGLRPEGGGYITFVGRKGAQNAMDRIQGVAQGAGHKWQQLDNMGDDIDRNVARENVRNAIANHKQNLNALVGIWSYNAPAIVDVVKKDANLRKEYLVVAFDAEPLAIAGMGDGMIDAMVVQNPYEMGYQGVRLMQALVRNDQATIKEMLPNQGKTDGDTYDTGLKVVVPDSGSRLQADMFDKKTQFLQLSKFREWLAKYKLTGS
jgi:putative heme-binding domain-containing protein